MIEVYRFGVDRVRVIVDGDGEPWFVASDVCSVLGYANPRAAITAHCKGVAKRDILTGGGVQAMTVIPERDVYRLIMRSRLPMAERFEEWVVGEVLPSIRKTGQYGAQGAMELLSDPAALRDLLGSYAERVIALEAENAEARPKVEVYDRIVDSGDTVGFREAAKLVRAGTGANETEFRAFLLRRRWAQRLGGKLAPAHYGETQGYVTVREREFVARDGSRRVSPELRITQRGVARAIELLIGEENRQCG